MDLIRFPGAAYLVTQKHRLLFGTFSEVHQHLQHAGLKSPDTVICGDVRLSSGIPQLVPEFLFFGHLFNDHHFDFATRQVICPLTILGTSEQCRDVRKIMQVSYLGAGHEVLAAAQLSPEIETMLVQEGNYFALKDNAEQVLPIDAFMRFLNWEDNTCEFDGLLIEKIGESRFRVTEDGETLDIDITLGVPQLPVWPFPEVQTACDEPYSLTVLGAAGPFQTESPSSSYLLTLNGKHYLFDCAPYTHLILERLGIAPETIQGIILSHIHDDHSGGLPAFLRHNPPIKLWTTREIYAAARTKLASILGTEEPAVDQCLDFHPIVVGENLNLEGATLSFHYACHSIPTIGITLSVDGERLTLTGDTAGHNTLRDMLDTGVISSSRFEGLMALSRANKVLVDCGEAIIHGYPQDYLHVPDTRNIVLAHRKDLPPEYEGIFTLAQSLLSFTLKPMERNDYDTQAVKRLLATWQSPSETLESWLAEGELREFAPGDAITPPFALITHGVIDLLIEGYPVARLVEGDHIGSEAVFGIPNVTALARGYARLLVAPPSLLSHAPQDGLRRLWEQRLTLARLFAHPQGKSLELGSNQSLLEPQLVDEGAYVVRQGKLAVLQGEKVTFLREHDYFGQRHGFMKFPDAHVKTVEPCLLWRVVP